MDVTVDGRPIKAIAQVSKQGFVYVFDRVTGDPIWPIEERPVPQETNMPGEVPSPTQPFPTKPAPFDYQGVTVDDLIDFTPEIRQMALDAVEGFRLGPLFTPLDRPVEGVTNGTIMRPPPGGTAGWSGAAVDPETGMLYVPSRNQPAVVSLYSPDPALGATVLYTHGAPEAQRLAQRGNIRRGPQMPQGLPLVKPPYSRMTAIDLNTGEHAWWVPTGNGDRFRNHPLLRDLDLPPLGGDNAINGPLLTKTLLIYCLTAGGTNGGPRLVAYDKADGTELASVDLPSGAIGTPMTYMVDGRQYIGLTVGGGPRLIAFALPEGGVANTTRPSGAAGVRSRPTGLLALLTMSSPTHVQEGRIESTGGTSRGRHAASDEILRHLTSQFIRKELTRRMRSEDPDSALAERLWRLRFESCPAVRTGADTQALRPASEHSDLPTRTRRLTPRTSNPHHRPSDWTIPPRCSIGCIGTTAEC